MASWLGPANSLQKEHQTRAFSSRLVGASQGSTGAEEMAQLASSEKQRASWLDLGLANHESVGHTGVPQPGPFFIILDSDFHLFAASLLPIFALSLPTSRVPSLNHGALWFPARRHSGSASSSCSPA